MLFVKDELWVVADTVMGAGQHSTRLHWLAGDFPHSHPDPTAPLELDTPNGTFSIACFDRFGVPLKATVARGEEAPPRGWLSRYYAEKVSTPSYATECKGATPHAFISLLGAGAPRLQATPGGYAIEASGNKLRFSLEHGCFTRIEF